MKTILTKHLLKTALLVCAMFISLSAFAQTSKVSGKVTDEAGEPLIGVTVSIDGTLTGTVTDAGGNYSLTAQVGQTLRFNYLGYDDVRMKVGQSSTINATLKEGAMTLDETIVVGYGTQSRKTLTTSIAKVDGDKVLNGAPIDNVGDGLKGRVAGLRVATNNGSAGESPRLLIRGGSSVTMGNDPIVIVDGIQRDLGDINPNDVESIEVLKDAASAGIYGARASNGVVLVTTKKGKLSKGPQISFEAQVGVTSPSRKWDLMNSEEFLSWTRPAIAEGYNGAAILAGANAAGTGNTLSSSMFTTRYLNEGESVPDGYKSMQDPLDPTKTLVFTDTDYQSQWFRTALWHKEYLGINGGNENVKYAASGSYLSDGGAVAMTGYNVFTLHGNTTFKVVKNLEAYTNFDYSHSVTQTGTDDVFTTVGRGIMMGPTHNDYDEETGQMVTGGTNVHQQTAEFYEKFYKREKISNKFTGAIGLKWTIIDGLNLNAQYGVYDYSYLGSYYAYGEIDGTKNYVSSTRSTTETRNNTFRQQFQTYLAYDKNFRGGHHLSATAGYDYLKTRAWHVKANSTGSQDDKTPIIDAGTNKNGESYEQNEALISFFGRVNYDWKSRYIVGVTFRADGSSKFAKGNQWGYFPAGSAAWIISEEPFWTDNLAKVMNNLKLRASYGLTGNNGIGLYDAYGSYSKSIYAGQSVIYPSAMANSGLTWETTRQLDLGLDFGFLNDRIRFSFDYYNKVTDNMLFSITLPDTATYGSVKANVGSAQFWGLEFEINTININTKDWTWTTDFTYSFNQNKVLSLPDEYKYTDPISNETMWRIGGKKLSESGRRYGGTAVGEPLGRIYGLKVARILQTEEEAAAAMYDNYSHGFRRSDKASITGRKDVGDFEFCNRPGSGLYNGEDMISDEDQFLLGNVMPHSIGGFNNTVRWKNLTFNIYFDYAAGHSIYNYMKARFFQNGLGNMNSNLDKMVYDCWRFPGDTNAKHARFFANDVDFGNKNFSRVSSWNVEKADYLCLRDISLFYDLPKKWVKAMRMKKFAVGISGNNIYYFTAVSGAISPETGMGNTSSASMYTSVSTGDTDANSLPTARKILFNIKITF